MRTFPTTKPIGSGVKHANNHPSAETWSCSLSSSVSCAAAGRHHRPEDRSTAQSLPTTAHQAGNHAEGPFARPQEQQPRDVRTYREQATWWTQHRLPKRLPWRATLPAVPPPDREQHTDSARAAASATFLQPRAVRGPGNTTMCQRSESRAAFNAIIPDDVRADVAHVPRQRPHTQR